MMKTKIALAVLLTTFALAPASAAKSKKAAKPSSGKVSKAHHGKAADAHRKSVV